MAKQKVMGVVRGQPRMTEINFYSHFKKLKIRFLGNKDTGWIVEDKIPENVEFVDLPLKPAWFFDPVTGIFGPYHVHRSWQHVAGLENYLKDVDVINISDLFYFYCGQCASLKKKLGKKLVAIVWETIPHHLSTYLPPYCLNVRAVLKNTDLFIARSKKAAEYLRSLGVEDKRIRVVYKGIDTQDFHPDFSHHGQKDKTVRILYVGQLVGTKGVNELLEAFIRLCGEFNNLELWFCAKSVGEPLEKKIKKLAIDYPVKWLGSVPYDKLPGIYRQCQIYCQLSQDWKYLGLLPGGNEWFSYAIIEAMASGLPVVTTSVGGIPEQVGEDNIVVKQKDTESTYLGLKDLILNPEKRTEIGKKNAKRAEDLFDIKRQAAKTEEAILEILG